MNKQDILNYFRDEALADYLRECEMKQDYGSIQHQDKELKIVELPYISCHIGDNHYVAMAEDDQGNEYYVKWPIIDEACEDESESCDWEVYEVTT